MTLPNTVFDGVIDVSHHNGTIDWAAVAGAGIVLAFVKATQGAGFTDPRFAANRAAAAAAGVLVVPYHFIDESDPATQAGNFFRAAGLGRGDPTMLDWETEASVDLAAAIGELITAATGRDPVGYYGWAQLSVPHPALSRWPLMLPEYPRSNSPGTYATLVNRPPRVPPGRSEGRPYDFHQYTPVGRVSGIAGNVDRSVWVGTADELRLWHSGGAASAA